MFPAYGPGQPDMITDPYTLMGPLAEQHWPATMSGMERDFIQRTSPYYGEDFDPYGMGWSYGPAAPAAPGMLDVNTMPPPPLLTGGPGLGNSPKGSGGGFGWQDAFNIGLPLAAGAAGFMAGIAPQGNPQTVLQSLSLAQRAQMMPRPEQAAAMQRQKFIQELIASGQATPEGLAQLKAQYPGMATEIDAVMPAAQDRSDMSRFIRSKMPGFGQTGAPPPPPGAGSTQSGSLGGGLPPPPSNGPQYDYLPSMSIGGDGKSSMSLSPHARPQPQLNDVEKSLSSIQTLNQEIQRLSQSPNQSDQNVVQQMVTARNALIFGLRGKPQSAVGNAAYDRRFMGPDADPTEQAALNASMTGQSRMPMKTAQGEAYEDVRLLQQGRGLTNADPQMASMQQEADTAGLAQGNKDVAEAVGGVNAVESAIRQFGSEAPQTKAAQAALQGKPPSMADESTMRGQVIQIARDYDMSRSNYRQIEEVIKAPINPQTERTLIMSFVHTVEPSSAVQKGEYDTVKDSVSIPENIKRQILENFGSFGQGRILTDKQFYDMVEQARRAYYSRLKTHAANMGEMTEIAKRHNIDPRNVTLFQPDGLDRAYLNPEKIPFAMAQAAKARANTLVPVTDENSAARNASLANQIMLLQGYNPYNEIAP